MYCPLKLVRASCDLSDRFQSGRKDVNRRRTITPTEVHTALCFNLVIGQIEGARSVPCGTTKRRSAAVRVYAQRNCGPCFETIPRSVQPTQRSFCHAPGWACARADSVIARYTKRLPTRVLVAPRIPVTFLLDFRRARFPWGISGLEDFDPLHSRVTLRSMTLSLRQRDGRCPKVSS